MPFLYYLSLALAFAAPCIIFIVTYQICHNAAVRPDSERKRLFAGKAPRRTYFHPTRALDGEGSCIFPPSSSASGYDQGNAEDDAESDERH